MRRFPVLSVSIVLLNTIRASSHSQFKAVGRTQAAVAAAKMQGSSPYPAPPSQVPTSASASPVHYVPPQSPLAYHNRLPQLRFRTLSELVSSPYAPHRLRVVTDVINSLMNNSEATSLSDMLTVAHIHSIFSHVKSEAEEATKSVELVGDSVSEEQLRVLLVHVHSLQSCIHGSQSETSILNLLDEGVLNPAVVFEIIKQLLSVTSILGLCEESVANLTLLMRLHDSDQPLAGEPCEKIAPASSDLSNIVLEESIELNNTARCQVLVSDHLCAMRSCIRKRQYQICSMLYRQFIAMVQQQKLPSATADDLSEALTSMANSVAKTEDFLDLKKMIIDSDISVIPVTVPLYSSLILASSRAVDFEGRLDFSLSLYRRLRDVQLMPQPETYAALIAVSASVSNPTQAFAFYREALVVCGGPERFPPSLYSNLVRSFAVSGFADDARKNLEVLVEAKAPVDRSAFHAVLSVTSSSRSASEICSLMASVGIAETPTTLALRIAVECRNPRGVDSLLTAYDTHVKCCNIVHANIGDQSVAEFLIKHEPKYCVAVEDLCLRLRVDPTLNPKLARYLKPIVSIAQASTNDFLNSALSPQQPTILPRDSYVAVLAADVLAEIDDLFIPSAEYFSAVVIPFSSIALLRRATAHRVGSHVGERTSPHSEEFSALVNNRREALIRFLKKYHAIIHLMSVEEELAMSRDFSRYGIGVHQTLARSAGIAMNLARGVATSGVYKEHDCKVVLATTKFQGCARYLIDNRKRPDITFPCQLQWWNPFSQPQWTSQGLRSTEAIITASATTHARNGGATVLDNNFDAASLMEVLNC